MTREIFRFLAESNQIEGVEDYAGSYENLDRAPLETRNSYKAMEFLFTIVDKPITEERIKLLHWYLMKGLLSDEKFRGQYRTYQVNVYKHTWDMQALELKILGQEVKTLWKRELIHKCPPAEKIPSLMRQYISRMPRSPMTAHKWFECIHPFVDGNGRTGRLVWAWVMMKRGKEVVPILRSFKGEEFRDKRQSYYDSIQTYNNQYFLKRASKILS